MLASSDGPAARVADEKGDDQSDESWPERIMKAAWRESPTATLFPSSWLAKSNETSSGSGRAQQQERQQQEHILIASFGHASKRDTLYYIDNK